MGGIHKTVKPLYEAIRAEVSFWDSRKAAQGVQPLVRNGVTQNSPDFHRPGCQPRRAHFYTGLAPV